MTQDELWNNKYQEIMLFIETNKRNPSKHHIEEHLLLNWIKHNRKLMNAGNLRESRVEMFDKLLDMGESYKRVNQYCSNK